MYTDSRTWYYRLVRI